MKRIATFTLALLLLLTCSFGTALATNSADIKASLTLSDYDSGLKAGSNRGEIRISYGVSASKSADSVGVSSIAIYKSDGSYVTTITGTTANGLVCNSTSSHAGTYSYTAISGVSYYAKVTVFARVGTITDSRTVTTSTVKAP